MVKFKRFLYLLSFEFIFLELYTVFNQSESGNLFFLGYSLQRLLLIFAMLVPTIYFLYGVAISLKNNKVFEKFSKRFIAFASSVFVTLVIEISIISCLLILIFLFWSYFFYPIKVEIFFEKLPYIFKLIQPYIYFYILFCVQIKLLVLFTKKKNEIKEKPNKQSLSKFMNVAYPYIILILIIFLATYFKYSIYANPNDSIATNDTSAYIDASKIDFFTLDFFTSNRPATIATYYKILAPDNGYHLTEIANSSENSRNRIFFQPGFDRITLGQSILSTVSWSFLALTFAIFLKTPLLKILGGTTILLFSIVPQISDWNNVLQSESLSISLFALTFSLAFHWVFRLIKYPKSNDLKNILLTIFFILSLIVWVFSRDSNSYSLIGLAILLSFVILIPSVKNKLPRKLLIATLFSISIIFIFHNSTFNRSDRWVNPIMNNIKVYILPYESQNEVFRSFGMPVDDEVLSLPRQMSEKSYLEHEELNNWLTTDGLSSYKRFLIMTPIHTISLPLVKLDDVFSVNSQPYFINRDVPETILNSGNLLHQKTPNILFLEIIFLIFLFIRIFKNFNMDRVSKFWLLFLFFINSLLMYAATIHGDASSMIRHSLVSILPFRLYFWVMLWVIIDLELFYQKGSSKP